jgi:hypothetical protein
MKSTNSYTDAAVMKGKVDVLYGKTETESS